MSEAQATVPETSSLLERLLTCATANGRARAAALKAGPPAERRPTSLVSYESAGHLLIIGNIAQALPLAKRLQNHIKCTLLVGHPDKSERGGHSAAAGRAGAARQKLLSVGEMDGTRVVSASLSRLTGSLGRFVAMVVGVDGDINLAQYVYQTRGYFDLVLDLAVPAHLQHEVPPLGYYSPGSDDKALQRALAEIPEMVGEFEKPKFFNYNPEICAHGASGLKGCRRCLDACPTLAITSIGDRIEVDPYLCQGGGSCATACPSGAITYAYPPAGDLLNGVRALLRHYRAANGRRPVLLYHDGATGRQTLERIAPRLPEHIIPFEVEEIGSVGMDAWLATLAYGASAVMLLVATAVPPSVRRELENQLEYALGILTGMGYARERLRLVEVHEDISALDALGGPLPEPEIQPANFAAMDEKRTMIRLAVEHLYGHAGRRKRYAALPSGAPFGQIQVDRKGCTLCMTCAGICPTSALTDGGDLPQLNFTEWNCIQCGLCELACPEHVIARVPRFIYDPEIRRTTRTLNEDKVFCCVACGRPFATQRMMDRITEKLSGHWMFQSPEALRRVQMCEECRVKDMFRREGGMIDVHGKP